MAIDLDEMLTPRPKAPATLVEAVALEPLAVEEIVQRIAALKAEITRCEAALAAKQATRAAADKFFKS